jgi:hypothetical protein
LRAIVHADDGWRADVRTCSRARQINALGHTPRVTVCRVFLSVPGEEALGVTETQRLPRVGDTVRVDLDDGGICVAAVDSVQPGNETYDALLVCSAIAPG